ncbi:MAG: hypothetical protein IPK26_29745 [Planctomycetes bacterium]|nr:hypothetical protein [Planctomycetota bacterium]
MFERQLNRSRQRAKARQRLLRWQADRQHQQHGEQVLHAAPLATTVPESPRGAGGRSGDKLADIGYRRVTATGRKNDRG